MRISVQADEGDEVSVNADFLSVEQDLVTLQIDNTLYDSEIEIETVTLSIGKARELAHALLSVVDAIEFVKAPKASKPPKNLLWFDREFRRNSCITR
jgi:hypothetical protein